MNPNEQNTDVWQISPKKQEQTDAQLDDQFVNRVVSSVHRKLMYRDIVVLVFVGFSTLFVEFLRSGIQHPSVGRKQEVKVK